MLVFIIFIQIILLTHLNSIYSIADNVYYIQEDNLYLLVGQKTYRIIPDKYTAIFFGYHIESNTSNIKQLKQIKSIKLLKKLDDIPKHPNDNSLNAESLKAYFTYFNKILNLAESSFNGLIDEIIEITPYGIIGKNTPSLRHVDGSYVTIGRLYNRTLTSGHNWAHDLHEYSFHFTNQLNEESKAVLYLPLDRCQEDLRLFSLSKNKILVSHTTMISCLSWGYVRIGYRIITLASSSKSSHSISDVTALIDASQFNKFPTKNWGALLYKNELHFIDSIEPLIIMRIKDKESHIEVLKANVDPIAIQNVEPISITNCSWNAEYASIFHNIHGSIHGGTPAIHVRNRYLAFYHTTKRHKATIFKPFGFNLNELSQWYTMGAYVFSDEIPFKLIAISPWPIVHESFVPRITHQFSANGGTVVFPMTIWLEDEVTKQYIIPEEENNSPTTNVMIGMGFNDEIPLVLKLNLNRLLNSLRELNC